MSMTSRVSGHGREGRLAEGGEESVGVRVRLEQRGHAAGTDVEPVRAAVAQRVGQQHRARLERRPEFVEPPSSARRQSAADPGLDQRLVGRRLAEIGRADIRDGDGERRGLSAS
jgi:hypothetical protein